MLTYDRRITISAAGSRRATRWPAQTLWWSELVERCKTPTRGTESLVEYLRLPKSRQDDLKDVGGFVGGTLAGERRKANAVTGRDVITLDMDNIPPAGTQDALRRIEGLGCAYAVYSTRKHEEGKPRLRLLVLLNRTATPDEYEPLARKLAGIIGIDWCDPSTFEASRLMYWPSCCADSQYVYTYGDKPILDVDGMLALYNNWRDVNEWPQVPGVQQSHTRLIAKQGEPTSKPGIVGAFCRVYDVLSALDAFLPGVYEPCADSPGRYTYTGGSTTGGAVIYDNGAFLYSHHATDPCGGKLVNAWDLVRLHRFGEQDDDVRPDTPTNRLPSYLAMRELAVADQAVYTLLNQERYQQATEDFTTGQPETKGLHREPGSATVSDTTGQPDGSWLSALDRNSTTGAPLKTLHNVQLVLDNDPLLKGRIYKDSFAERLMGEAPLPWGSRRNEKGVFRWDDDDDHGLRVYLDRLLGTGSSKLVESALQDYAAARQRNPLKDYLLSLEWDGEPRLDRIYVDYLGAEDCKFVRAVTRKAFVAAVARVLTDRIKFDYMTVICGPQGIGKSTLFQKLGRDWFCDSIKTFEYKEAEELIRGKWIIEIAELQAFNKADVNRVKQFLSKVEDQYRAAYGRHVKQQVRRCVFFGTTNDHEYLRDTTGNRRFWPVEAMVCEPTKSVFTDFTDTDIAQIWAEAVIRWRLGEPLYLSAEMEDEADRRRESHLERDPLLGSIEAFLERPVPRDWHKWDMERRQMFWGGYLKDCKDLVARDRVCALEIWRECLMERRVLSKLEAHRINAVLASLPGWESTDIQRFGDAYGRQRGFKRSVVPKSVETPFLSTKSGVVNILKNRAVNNVNNKTGDC